MEVDGHAEVTASLAEQADKAAAALDPCTGMFLRVHTFSASTMTAVLSCCEGDSFMPPSQLRRLMMSANKEGFNWCGMTAAAVRKLAGEVMAFEEGLPADALSRGGPTWSHERCCRWRSLLETTTRLPDVSSSPLDHTYACSAELMRSCRACFRTAPYTAQIDLARV